MFKRFVTAIELLAGVAVVVFVVMLFANEPGTTSGAAASPGGQLFQANCATCHGAQGEGGIGPKLAGVVTRDFPNETDQITVVTNGKGPMPAFGGNLTSSQIRQVVDYTRTGLGK
jgi:mono/diheme cytochrome c family protein